MVFYTSLSCLPLSSVLYNPDQKFPVFFLHLLTLVLCKLNIWNNPESLTKVTGALTWSCVHTNFFPVFIFLLHFSCLLFKSNLSIVVWAFILSVAIKVILLSLPIWASAFFLPDQQDKKISFLLFSFSQNIASSSTMPHPPTSILTVNVKIQEWINGCYPLMC